MISILFVIPNLYIGGTNKVLENLLNLINNSNSYQCNVIALNESGPYIDVFDKYLIMKQKHNRVFDCIRVYTSKALNKYARKLMFNKESKRLKHAVKNRKFDIIVAFSEGNTTKIVSNMDAISKIAWIHCDYKRYIDDNSEGKYYEHFNKIVTVSEATMNSFIDVFPNLSEKTIAIHNPIDSNYIKNQANDKRNIDNKFNCNDEFTIVSVGRLDPVKQFDLLPKIAGDLKNDGYKFKWYLIGGGFKERKKLLNEIKKNNVEDVFIWLGEKNNPYPYIASSDLLVCSSKSEACPNVINEAKILHIPVLATDFPSVYEFIENEVNGIVCNINNFSTIIKKLIEKKDLYNTIKTNINEYEYDNNLILGKIHNLFKEVKVSEKETI